MAEPATAEPEGAAPEGADDSEVEMAVTSVEESGVDPDGYFDGVDESASTGDDVGAEMFDGMEDTDSDGGDTESSPQPTITSGLASDINAGFARAAVIGLPDEWEEDGEPQSKDDLQTELQETFEAFRLGHYGQECAQKYLDIEEDIHPAWGLLGASLICAAVVVYKRPDGDELIDDAKERVGGFSLPGRGGDDDSNPVTELLNDG